MAKLDYSARLYREFCKLLTQARREAGVTQEQLAEKLGCTQSRIAKIESGGCKPDIAEFIQISQIIGADAKEIVAKLLKVKH